MTLCNTLRKRNGESRSASWNYVAKANELLAKRMERDRDKLLARHISQRRNLYARALNSGNYAAALAAAKDEATLEDLYQLDLIRTMEELKRRLEEVEARNPRPENRR